MGGRAVRFEKVEPGDEQILEDCEQIRPQTAEANCGVVQAFRTEPVGETRISSMTFRSGP
jgi:hypothetical protein